MYYLWTEAAQGCISWFEVMIMDSFAAFMYLFGMSGVRKIVLYGWRIVFVIDVQKGIHYLVLLIFFFSWGTGICSYY